MPETPLDRNLDRLADRLVENATIALSGTRLAEELCVAPSTLWDWIERLRAMGMEIRGLPGTGYQLLKIPDILTAREVKAGLHPGSFGCRVHHFYKTDSTMNEAS